jgi:hypothetical protein
LLSATLVARRHTPTRYTSSTYLVFHHARAARLMWRIVRPIHLRVEQYLLSRAARMLTQPKADLAS